MDYSLASAVPVRRPAPPLAAFAGRNAVTAAAAGKLATATNGSAANAASAEARATGDDEGFSFTDVLSMLNPLQYLPVLGSIYRASTGDTIPEAVRDVGSLVVSAFTGGPIGVAIGAVTIALEKIAGIDPDQLAQTVLSGLGLISDKGEKAASGAAADTAAPGTAAPGTVAAGTVAAGIGRFVPWTRRQRAAYASSALATAVPGAAFTGAAGLKSAFHAAARQSEIAATGGLASAASSAQRQAAANAYARRTLSHLEPFIRERITEHSA